MLQRDQRWPVCTGTKGAASGIEELTATIMLLPMTLTICRNGGCLYAQVRHICSWAPAHTTLGTLGGHFFTALQSYVSFEVIITTKSKLI